MIVILRDVNHANDDDDDDDDGVFLMDRDLVSFLRKYKDVLLVDHYPTFYHDSTARYGKCKPLPSP